MGLIIKTKSMVVHVCSDGKEFIDDEAGAIKHEARIKLKEMVRGGEWYKDDVVEFIIDNWEQLIEMMEGRG